MIYKRTSSSVRVQYLIARPAHVFGGGWWQEILTFDRPATNWTQTIIPKIYFLYYNIKIIESLLVSGNLWTDWQQILHTCPTVPILKLEECLKIWFSITSLEQVATGWPRYGDFVMIQENWIFFLFQLLYFMVVDCGCHCLHK